MSDKKEISKDAIFIEGKIDKLLEIVENMQSDISRIQSDVSSIQSDMSSIDNIERNLSEIRTTIMIMEN